MLIKLFTITTALIIFLLVLELIRKEKLTFKYALGWLGVAFLAIGLSIFDQVLFKFSRLLGFELASNFIFFSLLCIFVFLSLLMTVFLCQQNSHNDKIAQKLGLLEFEVEQMKNNRTEGKRNE